MLAHPHGLTDEEILHQLVVLAGAGTEDGVAFSEDVPLPAPGTLHRAVDIGRWIPDNNNAGTNSTPRNGRN